MDDLTQLSPFVSGIWHELAHLHGFRNDSLSAIMGLMSTLRHDSTGTI